MLQIARLRAAHEHAEEAVVRRTAELAAAHAYSAELQAAAAAATAATERRQAEVAASEAEAAELKVGGCARHVHGLP